MSANPYLARILSGPVAAAVATGMQNAMQEPNLLISYWSTLSILNAQDADGTLGYVGSLVGYTRPLVSNIFLLEYAFLFTNAPGADSITSGFCDVSTWPLGPGGQLDTALPVPGNYMPPAWYKSVLGVYAQAKYYGNTLYVIDLIAQWTNTIGMGTGYTITRDRYGNVVVTFKTNVAAAALYVANSIVQGTTGSIGQPNGLQSLPLVVFQEP